MDSPMNSLINYSFDKSSEQYRSLQNPSSNNILNEENKKAVEYFSQQ